MFLELDIGERNDRARAAGGEYKEKISLILLSVSARPEQSCNESTTRTITGGFLQ